MYHIEEHQQAKFSNFMYEISRIFKIFNWNSSWHQHVQQRAERTLLPKRVAAILLNGPLCLLLFVWGCKWAGVFSFRSSILKGESSSLLSLEVLGQNVMGVLAITGCHVDLLKGCKVANDVSGGGLQVVLSGASPSWGRWISKITWRWLCLSILKKEIKIVLLYMTCFTIFNLPISIYNFFFTT